MASLSGWKIPTNPTLLGPYEYNPKPYEKCWGYFVWCSFLGLYHIVAEVSVVGYDTMSLGTLSMDVLIV
jgi:hypothetical protein